MKITHTLDTRNSWSCGCFHRVVKLDGKVESITHMACENHVDLAQLEVADILRDAGLQGTLPLSASDPEPEP